MSLHAELAISALARTVQCAGSVTLSQPFLNTPRTEEQIEGDAGHWVALQTAQGRELKIDDPTPQGLPVDRDMLHGAKLYAEAVGLYAMLEMPVQATRIHPTKCWGTPDAYRLDYIDQIIRLRDYKYGHLFVDVFECWQLIGYLAGILDQYDLSDEDWTVEFTIVQPRQYHKDGPVRTWRVKVNQLRPYFAIAHAAAMAALPEVPGTPVPTRVGPECLFCPARHVCTTLQRAGGLLVDFAGLADPISLPPEALGQELRFLDAAIEVLTGRRTGLAEQAISHIRRGQRVPGYMIGQTRPRTVWTQPPETVAAIAQACNVDIRKPLEILTPKQSVAEGLDAKIVALYSDTFDGKNVLVRDDGSEARKIFAGNTPTPLSEPTT